MHKQHHALLPLLLCAAAVAAAVAAAADSAAAADRRHHCCHQLALAPVPWTLDCIPAIIYVHICISNDIRLQIYKHTYGAWLCHVFNIQYLIVCYACLLLLYICAYVHIIWRVGGAP